MKIVTIASGKGGSCKSTTTLCLAAILSEKHKVLVADTDPQGSLGGCVAKMIGLEGSIFSRLILNGCPILV